MRVPHPHLSKPIYEVLPVLYIGGGGVLLALSYARARGVLAAFLGLAGIVAVLAGIVILLRRRGHRALRDEYRGAPFADDDRE